VSGTYHLTSTVGYQLCIADLVVTIIPLSKANIGKGATMRHRGVLVRVPLARGELDKGSSSRQPHGVQGQDSTHAYVATHA
jgi:hypothetical protein